jgi:hypothetical protein
MDIPSSVTLKQEYNKIEKCFKTQKWNQLEQLLNDVKLTIAKLPVDNVPAESALAARNILEIAVQGSLALGNIAAFKSYFAMLKPFYYDFGDEVPKSQKMYEMIGLNLMHLLSTNEIMNFHTELELLDSNVMLTNPFVSFAVKLEQDIMAGNYKKAMEVNLPCPSFKIFTDILQVTIREEIAKGMPKAYDEISIDGCKKMLNFESTNEGKAKADVLVGELANKYEVVPRWGPNQERITAIQFQTQDSEGKSEGKNVNESCIELAKMAINYAKEFEQIV